MILIKQNIIRSFTHIKACNAMQFIKCRTAPLWGRAF